MINSYLTLKLSCLSQNKTQEIILSNFYMHFYETLEESGICLGWQKWDVLSRVKNQYGMFCPSRQISVGCFVHPGEVVWDLLSTLQKMAWEFLSMGSFVWLPKAAIVWLFLVIICCQGRSCMLIDIQYLNQHTWCACQLRYYVDRDTVYQSAVVPNSNWWP